MEIALLAALLLILVQLVLLVALLRRRAPVDPAPLQPKFDQLEKGQERAERTLREEIARSREQEGQQARQLREEIAGSQGKHAETVFQNLGEMSRSQQAQFQRMLEGLNRMYEVQQESAGKLREEVGGSVKGLNDSLLQSLTNLSTVQQGHFEGFATQLRTLTESNEQRLEALRVTVEGKLEQIRTDNHLQLEQMRVTVDEKLQGALEQRLGESFKLVSERLEQVHKGLGEMQTLATGVGDLKRVLTNVKTRGTWGEVQLASLLDHLLTPDQFATNVATREGSTERVEFAIKLPGRKDDGSVVWLPIDAKFPQEDYLLLTDAQDRGDLAAIETAAKKLEVRVKGCARDICDKYLDPPNTTDFGIMFLPTEGLYAEVVRRTGLVEFVQRDCRVVIAGPTTLAALLNSLQMGFRTLAIEKRSSEVWSVLGAVKTEFDKFGGVLDKVKKKLQEASNVVDQATTRRNAVNRKLRDVEALPVAETELMLGAPVLALDDDVEIEALVADV